MSSPYASAGNVLVHSVELPLVPDEAEPRLLRPSVAVAALPAVTRDAKGCPASPGRMDRVY